MRLIGKLTTVFLTGFYHFSMQQSLFDTNSLKYTNRFQTCMQNKCMGLSGKLAQDAVREKKIMILCMVIPKSFHGIRQFINGQLW